MSLETWGQGPAFSCGSWVRAPCDSQKLGAPPQLTLPWVPFLRCACAGAEEQQRPISSVAAGLGNGAVLSHQIPGIRPRGV